MHIKSNGPTVASTASAAQLWATAQRYSDHQVGVAWSEDHGAKPGNTPQTHAMIEGSRLLEIEQGGHISNIEKPTILNTAVAKVFDESSRAAHRPS